MEKKSLKVVVLIEVFCLLFFPLPIWASEFWRDSSQFQLSKYVPLSRVPNFDTHDKQLLACTDSFFNLKILCHPDWTTQQGKDAVVFIVSADPAVVITVAKLNLNLHYIEELTLDRLEGLQQYADGFSVEQVTLRGRKAIKVKAFDLKYPEIRLLDYYFFHNSQMYGVHCSVNSKDDWEKYKYLIHDVVASLNFMDS